MVQGANISGPELRTAHVATSTKLIPDAFEAYSPGPSSVAAGESRRGRGFRLDIATEVEAERDKN